MAKTKLEARKRRKTRIRKKLVGTAERPRLIVFRSNRYIYAQVIDDVNNKVLASASDAGKADVDSLADKKKKQKAELIGSRVAEQCKGHGIGTVIFDRNGYKYHGRVKALADAARKSGLVF